MYAVATVAFAFACGGASCVGGGSPAFFLLGGAAGGSLYGDGSAGAKVVAANDNLADLNRNYTDFTVQAGAALTVPSGTVIRCTGTLTISGVLRVSSGTGTAARVGTLGNDDTTFIELAEIAAHPGIARLGASSGEVGIAGASRAGGFGGFGLADAADAVSVIYPPVYGGGGGGAGLLFGGEGGGSILVLAEGGITISGAVTASALAAPTGGGGGGGGIVILATPGELKNTGTISAIGGRGGDSDFRTGPGGGGAGGIIRLISPAVDNAGAILVTSGAAGTAGAANSVTAVVRSGGGGGGACGPAGGLGGAVDAAGTPGNATAGSDGIIIQTPVDPANVY